MTEYVFSPMLLELIQQAWLVSSVDLAESNVRSGALMLALAQDATTTVVDIDPYRLELAEQMGAQQTLTADEAAGATGSPRVVLECAGGRQSSTASSVITRNKVSDNSLADMFRIKGEIAEANKEKDDALRYYAAALHKNPKVGVKKRYQILVSE